VWIRHPGWGAKGALAIRINGEPLSLTSSPSSFVPIAREWRDGDRIDVELPMRTSIERLPDGSDYVAVLRGPIVLAAKTGTGQLDGLIAGDGRMAHVSQGPYLPLDSAPMLVGEFASLADQIKPVAGKPLTFTAAGLIRPESSRDLELVPFFRVHDARYVMYWRTVTPDKYPEVAAALEASEKARLALEARTLDSVAPGEQQPEVEHAMQGEGSSSGVNQGRRFRDASGWFSYRLKATPATPLELLVTYYADERGRRFDIVVGDEAVATVSLNGRQRDRFVDVTYPLPAAIVPGADATVTVKFAAKDKSRTGSIYAVRLVKAETAAPAP
jgi:hypothetical protein